MQVPAQTLLQEDLTTYHNRSGLVTHRPGHALRLLQKDQAGRFAVQG